jgi:ABC-2 type transport system permease protein
LGQVIVGLIKNPETVNSTTRLVYFVFIMVGMFGEFGILGEQVKQIAIWSPYGTVKHVLSAGMEPEKWNSDTTNGAPCNHRLCHRIFNNWYQENLYWIQR